MGVEIERKFRVVGEGWRNANPIRLTQGYLSMDPERTVRVRVAGNAAWLTIKGRTQGASRAEWEYPIPVADALAMLPLCTGPLVDKLRHEVVVDGMRWEVDEFLGPNQGLVVAELELEHEDQAFRRPPWLGHEVTDDPRYFNSRLAELPYSRWPAADQTETSVAG